MDPLPAAPNKQVFFRSSSVRNKRTQHPFRLSFQFDDLLQPAPGGGMGAWLQSDPPQKNIKLKPYFLVDPPLRGGGVSVGPSVTCPF